MVRSLALVSVIFAVFAIFNVNQANALKIHSGVKDENGDWVQESMARKFFQSHNVFLHWFLNTLGLLKLVF